MEQCAKQSKVADGCHCGSGWRNKIDSRAEGQSDIYGDSPLQTFLSSPGIELLFLNQDLNFPLLGGGFPWLKGHKLNLAQEIKPILERWMQKLKE